MVKKQQKKKHILITTDTFAPKKDGITSFLDEVIPYLAHRYDIRILAPAYAKKKRIENKYGVEIIRFPVTNFQLSGCPAVKATPGRVKKYVQQADIVWVNSAAPLGAATIMATKRLQKKKAYQHLKLVAFMHSIEWDLLTHVVLRSKQLKRYLMKLASYLGKYFYNKCDYLLVPSQGVAKELMGRNIHPKKIVIPLGVDGEKFTMPTRAEKEKAKKRLGFQPGDVVIGYCGRLSPEKNIPTLAKAFAQLRKKYRNIHLLIVGDGSREEVLDFVSDHYKITGFVTSVPRYLHTMDMFVMPSFTETSSLATMEALSCGVPVIATPVGHIKDYIVNGFNGFLFPKENIDLLKRKIEKLILNPGLRTKIGRIGRKTILQKYSWEMTITRLQRLFDKI